MAAAEELNHRAFVFIKPHAAGSEAVAALLKEKFSAAGISILDEGVLDAATIDEKKLIGNIW